MLFTAVLRLRRRMDSTLPNMHIELMGMSTRNAGAGDAEGRLMVGVQFAYDRRAVMTTAYPSNTPADAPAAPGALTLVSVPAGSASELSADVRYWLTPLPTRGPLLFIIRWPALGIEETVTELDGSAIAEAGAMATVLWPPVPPEDRDPAPPLQLPSTGWFAQQTNS